MIVYIIEKVISDGYHIQNIESDSIAYTKKEDVVKAINLLKKEDSKNEFIEFYEIHYCIQVLGVDKKESTEKEKEEIYKLCGL